MVQNLFSNLLEHYSTCHMHSLLFSSLYYLTIRWNHLHFDMVLHPGNICSVTYNRLLPLDSSSLQFDRQKIHLTCCLWLNFAGCVIGTSFQKYNKSFALPSMIASCSWKHAKKPRVSGKSWLSFTWTDATVATSAFIVCLYIEIEREGEFLSVNCTNWVNHFLLELLTMVMGANLLLLLQVQWDSYWFIE